MDKLLNSLGLNSKEIKLYKAVVKAGSVAPAALAKVAGVKRTTAYAIARSLVEKGLLIEDSTKRPRLFLPAPPKDVEALIKEERQKLDVREKVYKELAGELSRATAGKTYPVPQIRFIEEDKLERFLYSETPKWNKSIENIDNTWWGFQDHTFVEHFAKWIMWSWGKAPSSVSLRLLSNQSEVEKKMRGKFPKRTIKFWDKAGNFISTTWITGDYVILINTGKHPFYLVEIHDAMLAHDMREVFKNLWPLV